MQISTENGLQFTFLTHATEAFFLKEWQEISGNTKPETLKFSRRTFHFFKKIGTATEKI